MLPMAALLVRRTPCAAYCFSRWPRLRKRRQFRLPESGIGGTTEQLEVGKDGRYRSPGRSMGDTFRFQEIVIARWGGVTSIIYTYRRSSTGRTFTWGAWVSHSDRAALSRAAMPKGT